MSGVQGGDLGRNWPQPLGVFCNARTYPNRNSGKDVLFDKGLEVTKTGLLFGKVDGYNWKDGYHCNSGHAGSVEAASGNLKPSGYNCMDDLWACGLRLTRYAV